MSNASNNLEYAIGQALFENQPFPSITAWTVHLFTAMPDESGNGGVEVPIGANGYQPPHCDPGSENWEKDAVQVAGNTVYRNRIIVAFPTPISPWGMINSFGLKDQTGQLRFAAPFASPRTVNAGEPVAFLPGELQVSIG